MSRARGRKQQETQAFFAENPEAFDHDTQLSVTNTNGRFEVLAEGEKGDLRENEGPVFSNPLITLLYDLDTSEADFDFYAPNEEGEDFEGFLTLTEQGFGIIGEDEPVIKEDDDDEPELRNTAEDIREGEKLEVDFPPYYFPYGGKQLFEEENGPFGGTAVNIDFMVLNNQAGTVELTINNEGPDQLITFDVGEDSKGLQDNIGFVMPDGQVFDGFDVTVSGDVRVSLTGIDFSSNFDGMAFPPA